MDLLLQNTQAWKSWLIALVAGPVFVLTLVAAEWPFASFLMTKAAKNRFFGPRYHDFNMPSTSDAWPCVSSSIPSTASSSGKASPMAMLYAAISTWLGLALGNG